MSVDEAEQTLADAYLPLRLFPRASASLVDIGLDATLFGSVTLGSIRFGEDVAVRTEPPVNVHVNFPLAGRYRSRAGRAEEVLCSPGGATALMPGEPIEAHWEAGTDQVCLMFRTADVERELESLLGEPLRERLVFTEWMDLNTPSGHAWLAAVRLARSQTEYAAGLLRHELTTRRLEQIVIDGLLTSPWHNYSEQLLDERLTAGRRAVRRAVELLRARPEHPWTLGSLCAEVSVSAGTLCAGFREFTGTTPMAYLRTVRMDHVRAELLAAGADETTVTHSAHRWGFAHLGRFSADYRSRFGEPPSATLRG
ncbi:AraC family transcriptional regulator [Prauserella cavernicola]|uniref:AraC family transcriptional regulator n=1 Tax=Prauserella cavernicola TaxID=2800127 RepID=A0A934V398_9PSEU|nr:AraC family transcriptional regulator [Prauserella cavernicola]MBK1783414.1 AraC family transcriptional regulator [Prauserella cavernicola]